MSTVIPLPKNGLPYFDLQVLLDGVTYTLECRWNVRSSKWEMQLLDEAGQTILAGVQVVVANWPLFAHMANRQPPGALIAVDTSGQGKDPDLNDFGTRVHLIYISAVELAGS